MSVADQEEISSKLLTILPLGDSITQNGFGHLSYRYYLWKSFVLLHDNGNATPTVDFVGTLSKGYLDTDPEWPLVNGKEFDPDHEGRWGWPADQVLEDLATWLESYSATPDIALIHLGTNDCIFEQTVDSTLDELNRIVTTLHAFHPTMEVYVAKLIPTRSETTQSCLNQLNQQLDDFFFSSSTTPQQPGSVVHVVDMVPGFNVDTDTWDGLHPNNQGSEKIANHWLEAILSQSSYLGTTTSPTSQPTFATTSSNTMSPSMMFPSGSATTTMAPSTISPSSSRPSFIMNFPSNQPTVLSPTTSPSVGETTSAAAAGGIHHHHAAYLDVSLTLLIVFWMAVHNIIYA